MQSEEKKEKKRSTHFSLFKRVRLQTYLYVWMPPRTRLLRSMYTYIHVYIYIHIYVYMYTYMYVSLDYIYMYTCICICIHVYVYVYMYMYMYTCICICMYVYVYVCMFGLHVSYTLPTALNYRILLLDTSKILSLSW